MLSRSAELQLNPDRSIVATMREQSIGQAAARERGAFRGLAKRDYNELIERWIAQGATGVRVSKIEPLDDPTKEDSHSPPAGFEVDELPDTIKLETLFGSYVTSYVVKDGQLLFSRKLVVRAVTIPVADYPNVRSFFERIRAAEQSPVVLVKK